MCNTSTAETNHAQQPTVSVIMATYNGEKYIREQLDSILQQTYPIHEIIIQDDCSTDGTMDILASYAKQYPIIKVERNRQNQGCNVTFKVAAMRATGDFVAISDQDDVWYSHKIATQVKAIGLHDICYSRLDRGATPDKTHIVEYKGFFEGNLFYGIAGHTMLVNRQFMQHEEYWIDDFWYDWSLLFHAHLNRGVVAVHQSLNWHRDYAESVTNSQHTQYYAKSKRKPTSQPYVESLKNFRKVQQKPRFRRVYTYLYEHTNTSELARVHTMCRLMLSSRLIDFFHLCILCLKHRRRIYPSQKTEGLMGRLRSFFYPGIFAYHCTLYDD